MECRKYQIVDHFAAARGDLIVGLAVGLSRIDRSRCLWLLEINDS